MTSITRRTALQLGALSAASGAWMLSSHTGIGTAFANAMKTPLTPTLEMGFAKLDITPTFDGQTNWGTDFHISEGDILDPIYLRVIALRDIANDEIFVFVVPDMMLFDELLRDPTRIFPPGTSASWAVAAGVPIENLFIVPTHNHQGPIGFDAVTHATELAAMESTIAAAVANLEPVNLGIAEATNTLNVNRRPAYDVTPGLPLDNRVLLLKFSRVSDGAPAGAIVHYACHQTGLGNEQVAQWDKITTEIIGYAINDIEAQFQQENEDFGAVLLNGFYGAAGPDIYGNKNGTYAQILARGHQFGTELVPLVAAITTAPYAPDFKPFRQHITVPGNTSNPAQQPYADFDFIFSGAQLGSDLAFMGVSAEPFVEIGASVKAYSPYAHTITCANVNGDSGYIPTVEAMNDPVTGGLETQIPKNVFVGSAEPFVMYHSLNMLNGNYDTSYPSTRPSERLPVITPSNYVFGSNPTRDSVFSQPIVIQDRYGSKWVQADFGSATSISKVIIDFGNFSRYDCAKRYDIFMSDDPDMIGAVLVASQYNNSTCRLAYRFPAVSKRYLRVVFDGSWGPNPTVGPVLYDFRLYG